MPSEHPPGKMWCHSQSSGPLHGMSHNQGEYSRDHHRSTPRLPSTCSRGVDCCTPYIVHTCTCRGSGLLYFGLTLGGG